MGRGAPVVVLIAVLAASSCATEPDLPTPRHLFLITVDTLRADHMSLYGYARSTTPRIDELARQGVVFERAIAQWPKTGSSFASMMTGRYPQSTGLIQEASLRVPSEIPVLPELFRREGFTTLAVVSNAVLSRELGWHRGFDEYVETWTGELTGDPVAYRGLLQAGRVNRLARPLIEKHRNAARLLVWLHYSDPHAPYILPPDVANPFLDDAIYHDTPETRVRVDGHPGKRIGAADELRFYVAQYDANILEVDRHVAEMMELLDRLGLLRGSAVVFFADHGEDLGEHRRSYFDHGRWPYNTTAHVPLFMVGPGVLAGGRVRAPVELVDLFPTLAAWLLPGAATEGLEGDPLLAFLRGASTADLARAVAFSEAGRRGREHYRSVQDGRFKLIYTPPFRAREPQLELYDLERDPLETTDLAATEERTVRGLLDRLRAWMKDDIGSSAVSEPKSEEQMRALRALGYVD
jgi:arylsulfatase A-like enzyme